MHEMAIAQGILDIVLDAAARNDATAVLSIKLQVGEMTEVGGGAQFLFRRAGGRDGGGIGPARS
jgi:hydrogenase nickel incorporation protein HypA/HybF